MAGTPAVPAQRTISNVLWDRWLDPLHDLLANAFKGRFRVLWEEGDAPSDYLLVVPGNPTVEGLQRTTDTETGRYRVRIDLVRGKAGRDELAKLKTMSRLLEDVRGELLDNLDRVLSGSLIWHDGAVETETIDATTDDDRKAGRRRASLTFAASVTATI